MIAILLCTVFIGECFAYYSYSPFIKDKQEVDIDSGSTTSAIFDVVDNDYYKVYFFASPYYATGMGDEPDTDTDPLDIAKSENNPYNSNEKLMMMYPQSDTKFQNLNGYYACYKNKNDDGTYEMFEKRDYTGYIRQNEELGIEKTSTYISITVKGSISAEQLSGIVAASEFKDRYGFGPEFIGWTYDKNNTYSRAITTDGKRYGSNDQLRYGNEKGEDVGFYGTQVGNYGVQGEAVQVTSSTPLSYLDSLTDENDNGMGADGSKVGDKVIYLYPVFAAKNYNKISGWGGGSYIPFIKFRINPGENYEDKQIDEIDYDGSTKRYTVCPFYKQLDSYTLSYTTGNIYIDSTQKIQLDYNDWVSNWSTMLKDDDIKSFGMSDGYYSVEIIFGVNKDTSPTQDIIDSKISEYKETDKYVGVSGNTFSGGYYVIAFQKIEDIHIVGDAICGTTDKYDVSGYKTVGVTSDKDGNIKSYISDNIFLEIGGEVALLGKDNSKFTIKSMSAESVSSYNAENGYTDEDDKYHSVGENSSSEEYIYINDDGILGVTATGSYNFVFELEYKDGGIVGIHIGYRKNVRKNYFMVLKTNTDRSSLKTFYKSYDELSGNIEVALESDAYTILGNDEQALYTNYKDQTNDSIFKTISDLYKDYDVYDLSTGMRLDKDLFTSKKFYLNRNYVVYLEPKT